MDDQLRRLNKTTRILKTVCVILVISNLAALISLSNQSNYLKNLIDKNPYPMLDFSRNFRKKDDFIVNFKPLRTSLVDLIDQNSNFNIAIYLEFLNTGANIALNADERVFPASLTKLPVVMIIMKKVETGQLKLTDQFEIQEKDKDPGWGQLYKVATGTKINLEELIKLSLQESDNTAHNILYGFITPDDITNIEEELGLGDFFDSKGLVTAKEYSRIYRALYTSSYLTMDHSQYILMLLAQTTFSEFLSQGVEEDTVFSHKFGEKKSEGVFLDSGIVYFPRKPYMITVMLKYNKFPITDQEEVKTRAKNLMENISETAFSFLEDN